MAMTYALFVTLQPEFRDTDVSQVNGELQAVIAELDSTVWQGLLDSGVRYLTAHRLALSPYGQAARLVAKDGTTTYNTHFQRLKRMATTGLGRVAGPTMYAPNYPQFPTAQPAPLLVPGGGTVALVNGSPNITFSAPQTIAPATLLLFSAQVGVYYVLNAGTTSSTLGTLTAPYLGPSAASATWAY
jgi:hypothetical protein